MNRPLDAERILDVFLAPDAGRLADRVLDNVFAEVARTPQRRALRVPWRLPRTAGWLRLTGVAATLALAALAGVIVTTGDDQAPSVAPSESPAPTPSPAAAQGPLNTLGWQAYTSERYGFEILRPADWMEDPSSRVYEFPNDASLEDQGASGAEGFNAPEVDGPGVLVTAWSVKLAAETTPASLLESYCQANTSPCTELDTRAVPVEMDDGHAGSLIPFDDSTQAFFFEGYRVYIVAVWRPEDDPGVAPYGGARRLLEGLISTMSLLSEGPASEDAPPPLDATFTSAVHGYSIDFPASWTSDAATVAWDARLAELDQRTSDQLIDDQMGVLRVASTPLPDGVDVDAWIGQWMTEASSPCASPRATLAEIVVDGQPGRIRTSCGDVEATVVAGGRVYMFTLVENVPRGGVSARSLFEAMMATVRLTPESAELPPGVEGSPPPTARLGIASWTGYTSDVYGYTAAYPTDWTVRHFATRPFDATSDRLGPTSPALDTFTSPDGTVRVSHWRAPHDPLDDPGLPSNMLTWIEDFCVEVGDAQCTGIRDRAIPGCSASDDCSALFIVPFRDHVMAFFVSTPDDTINIVTVWHAEDDPAVGAYGGAVSLLNQFLGERNELGGG
jgi:hypothetical protein